MPLRANRDGLLTEEGKADALLTGRAGRFADPRHFAPGEDKAGVQEHHTGRLNGGDVAREFDA